MLHSASVLDADNSEISLSYDFLVMTRYTAIVIMMIRIMMRKIITAIIRLLSLSIDIPPTLSEVLLSFSGCVSRVVVYV